MRQCRRKISRDPMQKLFKSCSKAVRFPHIQMYRTIPTWHFLGPRNYLLNYLFIILIVWHCNAQSFTQRIDLYARARV
jgi:hypothetical protein